MKMFLISIIILAGITYYNLPKTMNEQAAQEAAKALTQQLGSRLKAAMQQGGPTNAITLCNTEAMPITRRVAKEHGMQLTRVTDKPRNPANKADRDDFRIFAVMQADLENDQLKPLYTLDDRFYTPLVIQPLCLNCHGEQLIPPVQKVLTDKYPRDQAVNYRLGDLRGAIRITPLP